MSGEPQLLNGPAPAPGPGPAPSQTDVRPGSTAPPIIRLLRPKQWPKNVLVLAAPAAAGLLEQPGVLLRGLAAVVAFTFAAAAVYAVNDVIDAPDDRRHPVKVLRPVASGEVSPRAAVLVASVAAAAALVVAGALGWLTLLVVVLYLANSAAYVVRLKHVPVIDVVAVACGFVLRALAGAAATHLQVSSWFLLVALFGSLFLVCAKRRAELRSIGVQVRTRPALAAYTGQWLDQVVTMSLTGTVLAYASWAVQLQDARLVRSLLAASVLPVLVGLLRYLLLVDRGAGERPEDVATDRVVLGAVTVWLTLVGTGLYLL